MAMVGQTRSVGAVLRPTVMVPCYIEVGNGRAVIHVHPRWDEELRKGMYEHEAVQVIVLPDPAVQLNGAMVGELEPGDETPVQTFEEKQREAAREAARGTEEYARLVEAQRWGTTAQPQSLAEVQAQAQQRLRECQYGEIRELDWGAFQRLVDMKP